MGALENNDLTATLSRIAAVVKGGGGLNPLYSVNP